jgi:hypothetical protein
MANFDIAPVAIADISKDGYQRDRNDIHVTSIVDGFDPAQWNLPKVVAKPGGGYRVVAGQHRIAAAAILASSPTTWPFSTPVGTILCQVISGFSSVEEEARLFLADDRGTKRLTTYDRHRAGLVAKEPRSLDVQRALDKHGLPLVHKQRHQNGKTISALHALNNVWGMGGFDLLDDVLEIVVAWPDSDAKRTEGYLVGGLGVVVAEMKTNGTWNKKRVLARLSRSHNWPTPIWGDAMKVAASSGLAFNSYRPYAPVLRDRMK